MSDSEISTYPKTPRNTVQRYRNLAKYDHHTIHSIINSSPFLHVSFQDYIGRLGPKGLTGNFLIYNIGYDLIGEVKTNAGEQCPLIIRIAYNKKILKIKKL